MGAGYLPGCHNLPFSSVGCDSGGRLDQPLEVLRRPSYFVFLFIYTTVTLSLSPIGVNTLQTGSIESNVSISKHPSHNATFRIYRAILSYDTLLLRVNDVHLRRVLSRETRRFRANGYITSSVKWPRETFGTYVASKDDGDIKIQFRQSGNVVRRSL